MATACDPPAEEDLRCAICLDVFTDPVRTPCGHNYCRTCITRYWDTNDVCRCPLCAKVFDERPEVSVNTSVSEMVHRFRSHKWKEEYEAKTEAEIQQMIRERHVKIQEVKHLEKLSRKDADAVLADSVQIFTALISCIQRSQAELADAIEEKKKTTEKQAEGFIEDLHKEMTQLEERISELRQLSHTEDHILQSVSSINTPPPTKDWTKVKALQSSYVGTVRTAVAQLGETLSEVMEQELGDAELRRIQQYAVNVTLDPDTAHPELILSEDGKQVSHGDIEKNVPDSKERFSPCACVLGKQSFSSGRFYYEVQVGGKTAWDLGVARESIDRKEEDIKLSPNNGYWNIRFSNGNEYWAADPYAVPLPVREELQKVGVFVDYEEGLVSYYDVEARVQLYSYTGCTFFTEKLFPYFSPCHNDGGTNSAPLIISPVNMDASLGEDGGNMIDKKLGDAELRRIQQYEVNVTLDPDTAHPELILSEDGKQVSHGDIEKNVPDSKERFSPCPCVLGKQSFSSGRFYYEVQVGGKTEWDLGVARESIDRKEKDIELSPNNGYWNIGILNGNEDNAAADPYAAPFPLREELQKVGVFVDYEEGLVSFYDVEARVHLYSYTDCSFFTEKLYPFFSPCRNDGGRNSAPLIISPVNMNAALSGDGGDISL